MKHLEHVCVREIFAFRDVGGGGMCVLSFSNAIKFIK